MRKTETARSFPGLRVLVPVCCISALCAAPVFSQDFVAKEYKNSIGLGAGGGISLENDAPNISITGQYTRELNDDWSVSVSLAYDKEFRRKNGRTTESQEYSLQATLGYELSDEWSVVGGFARGIIEKDEGKDWEAAGSRNWSVGVGIAYSIPVNERVSMGPSLVTAYSFENTEVRMELEWEVSYAF
ncbi:MAG: transporter [Pseudomonadota bacterium]